MGGTMQHDGRNVKSRPAEIARRLLRDWKLASETCRQSTSGECQIEDNGSEQGIDNRPGHDD
jgi:hypothetical protein